METKFFLNKIVKVDNIEEYTLDALDELQKAYERFLDTTEGSDPDYPGYTFGNHKKGDIKLNVGNNLMNLMMEGDKPNGI